MKELEQNYNTLYGEQIPQGLKTLAQDVYIDMDLYKGHIIGYVSSYLKGEKIDPNIIIVDEIIDNELEACLEKIKEYIAYKKKIDELAVLLKENLASEQNE